MNDERRITVFEGPAAETPRSASDAKARLLSWADETDERRRNAKASIGTIAVGGAVAVLGGLLISRLLTPRARRVHRGGSRRGAKGGGGGADGVRAIGVGANGAGANGAGANGGGADGGRALGLMRWALLARAGRWVLPHAVRTVQSGLRMAASRRPSERVTSGVPTAGAATRSVN